MNVDGSGKENMNMSTLNQEVDFSQTHPLLVRPKLHQGNHDEHENREKSL